MMTLVPSDFGLLQCYPVSPLVCPSLRIPWGSPGDGPSEEAGAPIDELDEVVLKGDMVFGDPIVGSKPAGPQDTAVRPVRSPKEMSSEAYADHCLTHLPYHEGCWYCVCA